MNDHQHPAHDEETHRLAITLRAIDEQVPSLRQIGWSGGAAAHAAFQVQKWGWEKSDRLLEVRASPYFGRIDVTGEDEALETYYIGPEGLANPSGGQRLIIDWRAPISAAFYRPDDRTRLKRRIDIKDACLVRIADECVGRVNGAGAARDAQADPMLHGILSEAGSGALGSIVRSIQAKQDELIRADDKVLVVQGAAGTGKTIVALHRIAYLLYQSRAEDSAEPDRGQADYPVRRSRIGDQLARQLRVAVFGPNKSYLRHIRAVLPELGERDVVETTFEEWVRGLRLHSRIEALGHDDDLEDILDSTLPREHRERVFRRARAKGSLEMGRLLSQYVYMGLSRQLASLEAQPVRVIADVAERRTSFIVPLPEVSAKGRLEGGTPLSQIRNQIRDRMRRSVQEQTQRHLEERGFPTAREESSRDLARVVERFNSEFDRRWPKPSVATLYTELIRQEDLLREAADGAQIRWQTLHDESGQLHSEDVAPLAYLSFLVDGPLPIHRPGEPDTVWTRLDHVVVDEAQDLGPLALSVLRLHADSLTILGDMNQTVYAHRGTRSWREVLHALGHESRQLQALIVSYRSTKQISDVANHVVRVGKLDGGVSTPFPREGSRLVLQAATNDGDLVSKVGEFVTRAINDGSPSVAVLTKTAKRARSLLDAIADRIPVTAICVADRQDDRSASVVIMPAYLAKGIEFDAVVVLDVDADTYATTQNDAAVLYVAITRALNHLMVVWNGTPSPLIAGVA